MATFVQIHGFDELHKALSYLGEKSGKKIARACAGKMATVVAKAQRAYVPASLARGQAMATDKGIGSRNTKGRMSSISGAKAGVAVGGASKKAFTVAGRGGPGQRRGKGVNARNLHWFAAGTADRYTGAKSIAQGKGRKRKIVPTNHARKFVGRINQAKWGGFIQRGAIEAEMPAKEAALRQAEKMIAKEVADAVTHGGRSWIA